MKKMIFLVAMCMALTACYSSSDATKTLQSNGFTNIEVTGHAWFACGKDDFYATSFTAKNMRGQQVSGAVCSGFIFKNSTIRW